MTNQVAFKYPEIGSIKIKTDAVDEWYGIDVQITWKEPFDAEAYNRQRRLEEQKWFDQNPGRCHVGAWPTDLDVRDHVVRLVMAHPIWEEYYAKPRFVTCEDGEDGPERRVQIPRFNAGDFSDWSFSKNSGWLSASDR